MDPGASRPSSGSEKRSRGRRTPSPDPSPAPAARLADDLLVEILSRVPYRSLCRFRCVSRHWRALITHPDRLPQSLVGFFHRRVGAPTRYSFADLSGLVGRPRPFVVDPSFPFLPRRERERLVLADSCGGLLLCRCHRFLDDDPGVFDYLVLDPATEKWVTVPGSRRWSSSSSSKLHTARLRFDPAVSSHFHVFEFQHGGEEDAGEFQHGEEEDEEDEEDAGERRHVLAGVEIYSSETRVWSHKRFRDWSDEQLGWSFGYGIMLRQDFKSVFLNGVLYAIAKDCRVGVLDLERDTWRSICLPRSEDSIFMEFETDHGFIGLSQGQLHFAKTHDMFSDKLTIWVPEDKNWYKWSLKHTVCYEYLVGQKHVNFGYPEFSVVAIHPERNLVFFVFGHDKALMSYDMDSGEVCFIRNLGRNCIEQYFPYVHMFSKSLADGDG